LQALLAEQGRQPRRVVLVGDAALCVRYTRALRVYGLDQIEVAQHATERGLWQLAMAAGLLSRTPP